MMKTHTHTRTRQIIFGGQGHACQCTFVNHLLFGLFSLTCRYNVSLMEEWLRSRGVLSGGAVAALEPLIQAVQLLQTGKKTEADAQALVQTCTALSSQQVALCSSALTLVTAACLSL